MENEVPATRKQSYAECENPGDYFFTEPKDGEMQLTFLCPCGCGSPCGISIREDGQHTEKNWGWNQDRDKPTTNPSIFINPTKNHWHGYLTDGVFRKV